MRQQTDWAGTLARAKHYSARSTAVPFDAQKMRLKEQMDYFKQRLAACAEQKDEAKAKEYVKTLIGLRAKQMALALENEKKRGSLTHRLLERYTKQFKRDCLKLVLATDNLLGIVH